MRGSFRGFAAKGVLEATEEVLGWEGCVVALGGEKG